eukprot:GSChrysophyteH1.ASY1.ANO1.2340.1 assembled CDS
MLNSPGKGERHMGSHYVMSIDQGTSSSRCMVFDQAGKVIGAHQREHKQHYPSPGMVEHDPEEIWRSVKECVERCLEDNDLSAGNIAALGITNQRETRSIDNIRNTEYITQTTGLPVSPYFSGTKIMHLLEKVPGLREDAESGDALFGTIDTWLVWKLTGGDIHITDVTNASRTLLMNLKSREWDAKLLKITKIPKAMLPQIRSSSEAYGVIGILGDQQAALFGQTCFQPGETKVTYGTGAFLMMNTGQGPFYALEGSVAYCGSLIQWLRDNLHFIKDASQSESLALSVADNGGVYFVPAFAGLYAPYWRGEARGVITGLTAYNTRAHITRAALEAAAFQTNEIIDAMVADSGTKLSVLKVDGGMTKNATLMQFQSDLLNTLLKCPVMAETTALGSAFAAGLAVGYYENVEQLAKNYRSDKSWIPKMELSTRNKLLRNWRKAVSRSLNWDESTQSTSKKIAAANDALISQLASKSEVAADQSPGANPPSDETSYWKGAMHASALIVAVVSIALKFNAVGCTRNLFKK